ncbi:hypothetical protein AMST5_02999 [freshwater sediment metagenome]|uniref:Uncharacterized protein n=1 Tax=freshwater sediment metagenome TaxID=556182 RepID=A0AA48M189_9ZZZZ
MPYRLGLVSTALRGRPKKADADNRANLAALDALRDSRVVDAMAWLPGEQEAISHIVAEACRSETNALQSFLGRGEPLSAEFAEHLRLLFIAKHPYMPYRLELVSTALRGRPKKADADNRANLAALYALGQIRSGAKSYLAPEEAAKLFGVPNASVDRWVSLHRAWLSRGPDTWLEWMLRDRATEIEAALKKRAVPGITRTA